MSFHDGLFVVGLVRGMSSPGKPWWFSVVTVAMAIIIGLTTGELIIRLKNRSMTNYDIEMWRYAKELKERSQDPVLDFEHKPNAQALLQSVLIRINNEGLRGGPLPPFQLGQRRILFLGSSITLGWGVPESETLSTRIARALAEHGVSAVVMNGGIGNYNATRYVHRFLTRLTGLAPTDIVVQAFVRDGEILEPAQANILLRNSELAMTLWIAFHHLVDPAGQQALEEHYRAVYQPDAVHALNAAYQELADYARTHSIRLYMVMTPDVHNLSDYKLLFVHQIFSDIAYRYGYHFVDLLPYFGALTPQDLWAMPGDPHPNARGHKIMANALLPMLLDQGAR